MQVIYYEVNFYCIMIWFWSNNHLVCGCRIDKWEYRAFFQVVKLMFISHIELYSLTFKWKNINYIDAFLIYVYIQKKIFRAKNLAVFCHKTLGGTFVRRQHYAFGLAFCTFLTWRLIYQGLGMFLFELLV